MAINTADYLGNLNSNFKEVYADNIEQLIPKQFKIQKLLGKVKSGGDQVGKYFLQPVLTQNEQGVSYSDPDDALPALAAPVPMKVLDAKVRDSAISIRAVINIDSLQRSKGSKSAFKQVADLVVQSMLDTVSKRVEVSIVYGRALTGIGALAVAGDKIAGTTSAGAESVVIASSGTPAGNQVEYATENSGKDIKVFLKVGEWAPGIFAGSLGTRIKMYGSALTNGDTITPATSVVAEFAVKKVDFKEKSVTLTTVTAELPAGDSASVTALLALIDAGTATHMKYSGAVGKEFIGLERIVSNEGTLFGLDASSNDGWLGNKEDIAGNISVTKMFMLINRILEKGQNEEETLNVISSQRAWNVLMADQQVKRAVDASYDKEKYKAGSKGVEFYHANGMTEVMSSLYIKEGHLFILNLKTLSRLGTQELGFGSRGKDDYFIDLEDNEAVQIRCRTSQCVFCTKPGANLFAFGITFAAGT